MKKVLAIVLCVILALGMTAVAETAEKKKVVIESAENYTVYAECPEGYDFIETDYGDFIGGLFEPQIENCNTYYTLLIAYSEEFADYFGEESRLNDLTEEQLEKAVAELTVDYAQPEVRFAKTGLDTMVIICDEQGSESEYISVLTIYHGYFVQIYIDELTGRQLTEEEIQTALDIMTSIELV